MSDGCGIRLYGVQSPVEKDYAAGLINQPAFLRHRANMTDQFLNVSDGMRRFKTAFSAHSAKQVETDAFADERGLAVSGLGKAMPESARYGLLSVPGAAFSAWR